MELGAQAIKPGPGTMDEGVRWLKIETRAGKPKTSGIGCSDGGLRGSDGGISDSDGESILVKEPWLGR